MARRTREQWLKLFEEQAASGLTATEFCRRNEICLGYFFQRRRSLGWRGVGDTSRGFVELKSAEAAAGLLDLRYGEATLSLPSTVSPRWVASLMRGLSRASL